MCVCVNACITSSNSKAGLDGVDQRVFSLATESATEIVQVQTPNHSSSETALLQPLELYIGRNVWLIVRNSHSQ